MPALRNDLIEQHVALVRKLATRIRRRIGGRLEAAELVGFGNQALVDAATRFDEAHGVQFSTFAYWRVRGAMIDGVRMMLNMNRDRTPRFVPLDEANQLVDESALADARLAQQRLVRNLPAAIARLDARERHFIRKHYFEGKTLLEAGAELGLSKSWASRLHARAIKRLGEVMNVEPA